MKSKADANYCARILHRAEHYQILICQDFDTKEYHVISRNACGMRRMCTSIEEAKATAREAG